MKRCQMKTLVGYEEIPKKVLVSYGKVVFRDARKIERWKTWCGDIVPVVSSDLFDEGESLPGVECEECRKAKAAADEGDG